MSHLVTLGGGGFCKIKKNCKTQMCFFKFVSRKYCEKKTDFFIWICYKKFNLDFLKNTCTITKFTEYILFHQNYSKDLSMELSQKLTCIFDLWWFWQNFRFFAGFSRIIYGFLKSFETNKLLVIKKLFYKVEKFM